MAALREVAAGHVKIVPDIQVGSDSGILGGVGAMLMQALARGDGAGTASDGSQWDDAPIDGDDPAGSGPSTEQELTGGDAVVEVTTSEPAAVDPPSPPPPSDTGT